MELTAYWNTSQWWCIWPLRLRIVNSNTQAIRSSYSTSSRLIICGRYQHRSCTKRNLSNFSAASNYLRLISTPSMFTWMRVRVTSWTRSLHLFISDPRTNRWTFGRTPVLTLHDYFPGLWGTLIPTGYSAFSFAQLPWISRCTVRISRRNNRATNAREWYVRSMFD